MKGKLIVLDGNDGSGKATQSALLVERLKKEGRDAQRVSFPAYDHNFFGAFLGECLAGEHGDFVNLDPKIASTLYAADRFESTPYITQALEAGKVIVADRFTSSNQMHQGGKISDEKKRIEFLKWLDHLEHQVFHIPRPDQILYLRVPVEVSLDLVLKKVAQKNKSLTTSMDVVEQSRHYLEHSHETANWLATQNPAWTVVECMKDSVLQSPEAIHETIWNLLQKAIS